MKNEEILKKLEYLQAGITSCREDVDSASQSTTRSLELAYAFNYGFLESRAQTTIDEIKKLLAV